MSLLKEHSVHVEILVGFAYHIYVYLAGGGEGGGISRKSKIRNTNICLVFVLSCLAAPRLIMMSQCSSVYYTDSPLARVS